MLTRDMACHTWALSGHPDRAVAINTNFVALTDQIAMPYLSGRTPMPRSRALSTVRQDAMNQIARLADPRTQQMEHNVYLCGGYGPNDVVPEHMWLEDRTSGYTYDTFINQAVRRVQRVGIDGQPFRPGCEQEDFPAIQIFRVAMPGYTVSQIASLPNVNT